MRSRDQANSHPLLLVFECWDKSLSSLARLGATCLLTEVISEKAAVRAQLALFVDVTRAGRAMPFTARP
ncbi:hypothetical protein Lalb_Chr00c24g0406791 (mitochondrion) [Lupinus albus]|uniref:Uncharacterized protein n=1 Tax=Lupinus albus TaxID=3870 RepID=A0A6A4N1A6_LUPAL|nr:hypothetical protein Lalb_Chr00c24g0406791 [Lupinus albus]